MINLQRLQLVLQTAINAYRYPTEANHLSHLGELSGYYCIKDIHSRMMSNPTGQRILKDKPRVPEIVEQEKLLNLNPNTFGYHYAQFMASHELKSSERPTVRYIQDPELAFVYQRYKDIHDFIHVLLMFEISIYDEIVVKWFEMVQLGLPSTTLSAFIGSLKLTCEEKNKLFYNLPTIISKAQRSEFMMNEEFEINMIYLLLTIAYACDQLGYVTFNYEPDIYGCDNHELIIRLTGEYIDGFNDDYSIIDQQKLIVIDVNNTKTEYMAKNFDVYCPGRHNNSACEIIVVLEAYTNTSYENSYLVMGVEQDNDVQDNTLFHIDNHFQLFLPQLAIQLQNIYYQYAHCEDIYYVTQKSLQVSQDQFTKLKEYSDQIDGTNQTILPLQCNLYIENFTTNSSSSLHLYLLILVITGIIILAFLKTFKKKPEEQEQLNKPEQELQNLQN